MAHPDLTSHHVNYLIWRFVFFSFLFFSYIYIYILCCGGNDWLTSTDISRNQVGGNGTFVASLNLPSNYAIPGHGEAAVMLQRAWNLDPQSLPFAPYIRTHALVSLVQKGLQFHELEQSVDKVFCILIFFFFLFFS